MVSMLDRGDSYRVEYLGSAMLSSMGTGLGVLQKPLRELYFGFRQAGKSAKLQERHLTMTSKGMTMTFKERRDSKNVQEVFYGVPNMLSWDAVEFVAVRGPDKKIRGAFEPIDNDISRNKDNLFSIVDKKYHFLQQLRHPPLFCVVLRRTQGVKALDVHAFVCTNDDEALGLVRALNLVQSNYTADESHETGVFAYNPFGKENVRSAAGFDRPGAPQGASGSGGRKPHLQGNSPGGSLEKQKGVRVLPREAPARAHSQRHKGGEFYGESGMVRARSVTNLASSGIFQLTQEDFLQGAPKSRTTEDVKELAEDNTYADHIERSLERPERKVTAGGNNRQRPVTEINNLRSVSKQSPGPFRRSAHSPQFGRGFDSVRDIDIGEAVPPPSREQKESPREARYTADSKTGQGYGLLSSSQGPLPGYAPRREGESRHREAESPYTRGQRETSPTYERTLPRNASPPREERSEHLRKAVPVGGQKVFPVGREPPPTPPQNLRPSTLERSPSNQSRSPGNHSRSPINPVRRSPSSPAGIRPSASGGRSPRENLPPPGRSFETPEGDRASGSRSPRDVDMRSKSSQPPPGRGFRSKDSPSATNKPIAMVTPQKIQGIRVLPMMPSQPQRSNDDVSSKSVASKSKLFDSRDDDSGGAREEAAAHNSNSRKNKTKNTQKLRNELSGNWQFNKVKDDKKQDQKAGGANKEGEDPTMNEKLLLTKKKDAEIASVMQNLRFDYNDTTISPHGTNFERSLGYFP